jgi:Domain of unknown function (DUF6908)
MIKINKTAKGIMDKLTDGLNDPGDHKEVDNASGAFMSAHVEHIGDSSMGSMFSVAHYYEQNGDLMKDQDMVLIRSEGEYYPVEFQQDPVIYQCAVQWDGRGGITGFVSKSNYPQLNPEHG